MLFPLTFWQSGATYYVDATAGNDANAGTQAAPWQTISKVNSATLASGDSVLFKRGETWTGQIIGQSGITYADYGSGAKPIIDAASATATAFAATSKSNITLRNIAFKRGTSGPIQFTTCTDVLLDSCEGSGAANDNLLFITNCARCTVSGGRYYGNAATVVGAVWAGIEIADGGTGFVIDGVQCDTNPTGIAIHNHTGYDVPSVWIKNCTISGNVVTGSATTNQGIQILCQAASGPCTILIENTAITGTTGTNGDGLRIATSGANYVSGSIIVRNTAISGSGRYQAYLNGDDITLEHCPVTGGNRMVRAIDCKRLKIYHSTLHETTYLSGFALLHILGTRTDTVDVRNNIIAADDTAAIVISTDSGATTNVLIDYNLYKQTTSLVRWRWSGTQYTFANWKTNSGQDAHSPTPADPLFTNAAGNDFTLQSGSPAINAGVAIPGVNDGYLGAAPDCGYAEKA